MPILLDGYYGTGSAGDDSCCVVAAKIAASGRGDASVGALAEHAVFLDHESWRVIRALALGAGPEAAFECERPAGAAEPVREHCVVHPALGHGWRTWLAGHVVKSWGLRQLVDNRENWRVLLAGVKDGFREQVGGKEETLHSMLELRSSAV